MAKKELTKKELEEKGKELAGLVIQLEKLQDKHKEKKKQLKDAETDLEEQIAILAVEVETGNMEIDDQVDAFDDKPKRKGALTSVKPPEKEEEPKH